MLADGKAEEFRQRQIFRADADCQRTDLDFVHRCLGGTLDARVLCLPKRPWTCSIAASSISKMPPRPISALTGTEEAIEPSNAAARTVASFLMFIIEFKIRVRHEHRA
jgi:hypothetical protein